MMRRLLLLAGIAGLATVAAAGLLRQSPRGTAGAALAAGDAAPLDWDGLGLVSIEGAPFPAGFFDGKAVLVVNTASFCGYTDQYEGLQALWEARREAGLIVLGVPSNDFGDQEPGSEGEIKEFCETTFGITLPMTTKQRVKGPDAHPLYRWAADATGPAGVPKWNFHKLLVGRDGRLAAWFPTRVAPGDPRLAEAIDAALAEPPPDA
ncbi:MAG: glutathione peroxidase [Azospirillaceae bacterium]